MTVGRVFIREQVARTNVCLFCTGIGRSLAIKTSMNEAKFDALEQYPTSALFTDAERDLDVRVLNPTRLIDVAWGTIRRMLIKWRLPEFFELGLAYLRR